MPTSAWIGGWGRAENCQQGKKMLSQFLATYETFSTFLSLRKSCIPLQPWLWNRGDVVVYTGWQVAFLKAHLHDFDTPICQIVSARSQENNLGRPRSSSCAVPVCKLKQQNLLCLKCFETFPTYWPEAVLDHLPCKIITQKWLFSCSSNRISMTACKL